MCQHRGKAANNKTARNMTNKQACKQGRKQKCTNTPTRRKHKPLTCTTGARECKHARTNASMHARALSPGAILDATQSVVCRGSPRRNLIQRFCCTIYDGNAAGRCGVHHADVRPRDALVVRHCAGAAVVVEPCSQRRPPTMARMLCCDCSFGGCTRTHTDTCGHASAGTLTKLQLSYAHENVHREAWEDAGSSDYLSVASPRAWFRHLIEVLVGEL